MRRGFDDRRDQQIADEVIANTFRCRKCNGITDWATMAALGAQCSPCYGAWVAEANPEGFPQRPLRPDERAYIGRRLKAAVESMRAAPMDPRAWARRLQDREEAGERLTRTQAEAWRKALRHRDAPAEVE